MSDVHARQARTLVVGRALATLGEALIPLVIVRLLGKAEVGDLASAFAIHQIVALLFALGVGNAVMYFIPTASDGARGTLAQRHLLLMALLGVGAGVVLALVAALSGNLPEDWHLSTSGSAAERVDLDYLYVLAFLPIVDLPARLLPNLFVVEKRADWAAYSAILKSLGQTLATLVPAALGLSLWWVVGASVVFGWLYLAGMLSVLRSIYAPVPRAPSDVTLQQILSFSVPLGLTDMISMLVNRLDTLLVVAVLSTQAVAEYQVGAFQLPFLTTIAYSVGSVYTPLFRELFANGRPQEAVQIWRQSAEKVSLLVVPVSLVFFVAAEEVISLLFTSSYLAAVPVFRCYLVLTMTRVTAFGNLLVAAGKPRWVMHAAAITLLAHFSVSVPLLAWLGFIGPALGTAWSVIPMFIAYCAYIARAAGVPFAATFSWKHYLQVLSLAALPAWGASVLKAQLPAQTPADLLVRIAGTAVLVLGGFLSLAIPLGFVKNADVKFVLRPR
jgi:O-antigen/teichoic acid export membrane protein